MPNLAKTIIILCLSTAIFQCTVFSQTYLPQEIYGVLGPEGNPYYVTIYGSNIPAGQTLTILPGVDLQFSMSCAVLTVYGELNAEGTEEDSIRIRSLEGYPPTGASIWITLNSSANSVFRYCDMEGTLKIDRDFDVENCSLSNISYCHSPVHSEITDCIIVSIRSESYIVTYLEVSNCEVGFVGTDWVSFNTYLNCLIGSYRSFRGFDSIQQCVINGNFITDDQDYYPSHYTLIDNSIFGHIESDVDSFYMEDNIIFSYENKAIIELGPSELYNNTIIANEVGIYHSNISGCNNIIVADTGFVSTSTANFHYNVINSTVPAYNCSLSVNNMIVDPMLIGGNPFNFNLQPCSPCIDAGNPSWPYDPDETRADIGALFYNQDEDHYPVFASDTLVDCYPDSLWEYWAKGVDDGDYLNLIFDGLPDWVSVVQMDYTRDSLLLTGIPPFGEPSFYFTVEVIDDFGKTISQVVKVRLNPHPLIGAISGALYSADSVYTVMGNVEVPAGDTLTIEPGVRIQFNRNYEGLEYCFKVEGTLNIQGTETDTIYFHSSELDPQPDDWWFTTVYNCGESEFLYCSFSDFTYLSTQTAKYDFCNCSFANSVEGIYFSSNTLNDTIEFRDCEFKNVDNCINGWGTSSLIVTDCEFVDCIGTVIYPYWNDYVQISGSNFINSSGPLVINCPNLLIENNKIIGGMISVNESNGIIRNNVLDCYSFGIYVTIDGIYSEDCNVLIENNTINNCNNGMMLSMYTEDDTVFVVNNIITGCQSGIGNTTAGNLIYLQYNNLWDNIVDYQGFSPGMTDIHVDPQYLGISPFEFHLSPNSPCIDAGNPLSPLDPDSTRADMGAYYYDQLNVPPQITDFTPQDLDSVNAGTVVQFASAAEDPDSDSLFYFWVVNNEVKSQGESFSYSFPTAGTDTVIVLVTDGNGTDEHTWIVHVSAGSDVWGRYNNVPRNYLWQNYPNPCNSSTIFFYELAELSDVKIEIFNILGQKVAVLADGIQQPGFKKVVWNSEKTGGKVLASGLYIYRMQATGKTSGKEFNTSKKLIMLK